MEALAIRATDTSVTALSVAEAAKLIADKKLSPVELVGAHLDAIAASNDRLFAYITVVADRALAQAREAESEIMRGRHRGPLHGIPYSLKDNYYTNGIRTTFASRLSWDWVPQTDATLHARLVAAGAILLGKNNTWEYGTGMGEPQTDLPFPVARNAWNEAYFAGGSSSGTGVSVGAGLAMFGLGSDTGGSVRVPAAVHGLFGLKPTYGRLSRAGILPNSFSLDAAGPLTRTVRDGALVMQAIAGVDPKDPTSVDRAVPDYSADLDKGVKGLRIGCIRRFHTRDFQGHAEVVRAFEAAVDTLRRLGAEIVEVDVPHSAQDYRLVTRVVGGAESLAIHAQDFRERSNEMGVGLREKFLGAMTVSALEYIQATRWRREMTEATDAAVSGFDAIVCAGPVFRVPMRSEEPAMLAFMAGSGTCVFNVSGHPAATVATGIDDRGLPTSMQVVGKYWDEAMVMRVAHAYEQANNWRRQVPRTR
jgi:aspartyl-tRNA(Asn)/glutamyl-tRNA(Gln) amidotransferase subunit A